MSENIETILKKYMPLGGDKAQFLCEAMNYSLFSPGKRIRPTLMLETYKMLGGTSEEIEPFMCAIEMIHSYSLVHDDLPAMDNDTLRRGIPTTWSKYGEDMGILAGDGLLTYAFETAAKAFAISEDKGKVGRCIEVLANKAGVYGMVGGQAVDVALTGKPVTADSLDFIYRLKTGALLEAAMMIGAIMAGAGDEDIKKSEEIASLIGLAFQIKDDILDITSTEDELGKPIGSDDRNEKTTFVSLYGLKAAQDKVSELTKKAIEVLNSIETCKDKTYFITFINKLESRTK